MTTSDYTLSGSAPCKHCGTAPRGRLFDATGRVDVPRLGRVDGVKLRRRLGGTVSKPIFPGYTQEMQRAGVTAPPVIFCPKCDAPDPDLTLEQVNRDLDAAALDRLMTTNDDYS